ncbi:MAG: peroxiredoxin [Bacteroidetes bacterium]|nr:MAG: peroxiredoxin [Bacteroidota bacterium]
MSLKNFTIIFLFVFFIGNVYSQTPHTTAPDFSVKTLKGDIIQLYPLLAEGKIVVVDFFSTSCGPCQTFAYDFEMAYESFGSNNGNVFFLGINYNGTNADVIFFDSLFNITLPSASGLDGGGNIVFENYLVAAYPTVIVIMPDKTIAAQHVWEPSYVNITEAVLNAGGTLVHQNEMKISDAFNVKTFPNPTTNELNVSFDLSNQELVTLTIKDIYGRSVLNVVSQKKYEAGNHQLKLYVQQLPAGNYLLELEAGNQFIHKKILLQQDF